MPGLLSLRWIGSEQTHWRTNRVDAPIALTHPSRRRTHRDERPPHHEPFDATPTLADGIMNRCLAIAVARSRP